MKRPLFVILFAVLLGLLAFVPGREDPIDRFVTALQKWTEVNPYEKVYLHMDKPYYALGDTIWFKGYLTIGSRHQLSKMSGALYVELIDERDSLLSMVKLPLTAGMAMGDFAIVDNYKAGNFRIRAYTQWMRNAGEEYFFDKTFAVGDPLAPENAGKDSAPAVNDSALTGKSNQKGTASGPIDVQFFPEGGNLVNGLNCRIGFKALGVDGKGAYIAGKITDLEDREITTFESTHAGMGVFTLVPEAGKSYKAMLRFSDGSEKTLRLPPALEQGYGLAIYQPGGDSILVRINATPGMYAAPQSVKLVAQSGGETIFASGLPIDKKINSIWLKKSDFPSGIAQFTLFDERDEPLNERIAFIKSYDRMELSLTAAKKNYNSRERVEMDLEARDKNGQMVAGNFSVSVVDEAKAPSSEEDETSIFSSLLLSADLKGYIEKPNFYFIKDTVLTNKALDNLMLTQGFRRFVWKNILNTTAAQVKPVYKAESLGTEISGRVQTLAGKPVGNGVVTLMSMTPGFMEVTRTNANGQFRYEPIMLADSLRFAVQGRGKKNSKRVEVILDTVPGQVIGKNKNWLDFANQTAINTELYLDNIRMQDELAVKMGITSRVNRLKEIRIISRNAQSDKLSLQGGLQIPNGHADMTFVVKEDRVCATLGACLMGKLGGVSFFPRGTVINYPHMSGGGGPLTVILNGRKLFTEAEISGIFDFNEFEYRDIVKIDVVIRNQALMSMLGTGPAILIYTKHGALRNKKSNPDVVNLKPRGFNKAREFYAPRYDQPALTQQQPDLRSTIYWNPKLKTYASGLTKFNFYNADGAGKYKVVVEGINAAGDLARAVYRYEVAGAGHSLNQELARSANHETIKTIQSYQQRNPTEKLYVHTDKSYYNLGDTLWFKAYLFDASSLTASKRSGILYVELNDDTAEAVRRISIPIKEGVGYAQIPLTRKIFHEGGYTFRAYTNWMQNFGSDFFFTKRFYLGVPAQDSWLVRSNSKISKIQNKDVLQTEVELSRTDQGSTSFKQVEVRVMEGDKTRYKELKQTSATGKLQLNFGLPEKADGKNLRLEISTVNNADGGQRMLVPLDIVRPQMTDLQFMPESGHLVAGLKSIVGFKAIGEDGRGVNVGGEVIDSKGAKVATFNSLYKGMGSFEFTPIAGESYFAKITEPEVLTVSFPMPAVQPSGIVLTIRNDQRYDSIEVKILASPQVLHLDSTYYLMATSRGKVTYAQPVDLKRTSYRVSRELFPNGVTRFTLLRNKTPLNERIIFLDRPEQMKINVQTNRSNYHKRDSVEVTVRVHDAEGVPLRGNFSLAVTDGSQVKPDTAGNFDIATNLFTSDLKGTVETPGYYFRQKDKETWLALDNLMLTQGWTGYDWKEAFVPQKPAKFEGEKYQKIEGKVVNLLNKPVKGARVLISSQKPSFITETITDESGKYVFQNLPQIDSGSFFLQARTSKGNTMNFGGIFVNRLQTPKIPLSFRNQVLPWYVNTDQTQLNYVKNVNIMAEEKDPTGNGISLREVKIFSKKKIEGSWNPLGPDYMDLVLDEKDIKESAVMNLYQLLKQKLPGFSVTRQDGYAEMKLDRFDVNLIIDGNPYRSVIIIDDERSVEQLVEELSFFQIATFKGLEVVYNRRGSNRLEGMGAARTVSVLPFVAGANGRNLANASARAAMTGQIPRYVSQRQVEVATIYLTTRMPTMGYRINKPDQTTYRPLPLMLPKEFYSPKYGIDPITDGVDLRSTIYWKPDIITNDRGEAKVVFYTSDVTGTYHINIQGADMNGRIGSAKSVIKVIKPNP
ncbi:MAG TPA: carboxypeptidase-like regulatory domain-containing protein [Pedobacter sp.]|nr:carboxypeptidase-like regulatory domain-containing protein [Pedobacter sp.]